MQIAPEVLRKCWFLTGPTACGKTETSLLLAERLNAEIIALDSMSLYRGMDIGTAKATADERQRIPHHMLDVIEPDEEYSLAQYVETSAALCDDILSRGKTPLFVGGTGLYLRGLLRGVFEGPPADWDIRRELQQQADANGPNWLHDQLKQIDPETAELRHPNDHRRLIRAIEVFRVTGQPFSSMQHQEPLSEGLRPKRVFWFSVPRPWLHDRINRRVDLMMESGLLREVQTLLASDHPPGRTAGQALGYSEIIQHLKGRGTLEEAVTTIKTRTRQFAKRQHTWFRNLVECRPLELTGTDSVEEIVSTILTARDR